MTRDVAVWIGVGALFGPGDPWFGLGVQIIRSGYLRSQMCPNASSRLSRLCTAPLRHPATIHHRCILASSLSSSTRLMRPSSISSTSGVLSDRFSMLSTMGAACRSSAKRDGGA